MKEFIATVTDKDSTEWSCTLKATNKAVAIHYLEQDCVTVNRIEDASTHHFCKYCGEIVEGTFEDLLCDECRSIFGHALYSEL